MLTLLLVQMFPLFLAFVAIYLIMLRVSDVFPHIGLNTRSGLILVYLGGVLGVNAWLMKGFFDSIPKELDESAKVDGATATQIFWIVILPLGAPVLAVIGLLSFIATLNEYVLASVLLQSPDKFTLSVGLFTFVSREYGQQWGPFCAGVVLMAVPVVILFLFLQRFIAHGLTGGVKGSGVARPPRTTTAPSCTCSSTPDRARRRGDGAAARAARGRRLNEVGLRYVRDGEPRSVRADDRRGDGETDTWWRATFPVWNPVTSYRWVLAGGDVGYGWVNGVGLVDHDMPDADDFVLSLAAEGPEWHLRSVVYQIFPDRFATSGHNGSRPEWAVPRSWDELPTGRGPDTPRELFGGDLAGIEAQLDHIEQLGANVIYLTPIFPATSTHRYDATSFDRVDPLLGGDEALASLTAAAHRRGMRVIGDLTLNHVGVAHDWFAAAWARSRTRPSASSSTSTTPLPHGYEAWLGRSHAAEGSTGARPSFAGEWPRSTRHWLEPPFELDGWRIDVANMVGRYGELGLTAEVAREIRAAAGDRRRRRC